jgi:hypothetical protein
VEGQFVQRAIFAFLIVSAAVATAQSPVPLLDSRLSVNTLLREDIFAGLMRDDLDRFARGEKNLELLLEQRPEAKPLLLAWKAGATVYRAVRAFEDKRNADFDRHYQQALALFSEAKKLDPKDLGIVAVTGGTYGFFADRLPREHRAAAWSQAYESYQLLWKQQSRFVDKLPGTCAASFLPASPSPRSAPAARRKPTSIWIRSWRFYPTPLTSAWPKNGRRTPTRHPARG